MTDKPHDDTQGRLRDGYAQAREAATDVLTQAGETARKTAAGLDANPIGILVGGLAVGVLAGALLPRSDREKELLAPVGARIGATAKAAAQAARETGQAELADAGISKDAAREQVKGLFEGISRALTSAGSAAAKAATQKTAA
jgi:hypothetical protein